MTVRSRLRQLEKREFKCCPLCGTDWQAQQQANLAHRDRAYHTLHALRVGEGVQSESEEEAFLASIQRSNPDLIFFTRYQERAGWDQQDVPRGYCSLCGKDLLTAPEREQEQFANLVAALQHAHSLDESTATHEAQEIMKLAQEEQ